MKLKFWIGIAISAVIVWLLVRAIDLGRTAEALMQADYRWLIPAGVAYLVSMALRAARWQTIFSAVQPVRFRSILSVTMIGFMGNMILPARLGEFIRAYLIGRKENVSSSTSLATIVIERLFDGFTIILILVAIIFIADLPAGFEAWAGKVRAGAIGSAAFYGLILAFCVALKTYTDSMLGIARRVCSPLPRRWANKLLALLERFADGLAAIKANRQLVAVSLWSVTLWIIIALSHYPVFLAFHLDLPLQAAFLLMVFQAFAVMLPSSPGYIGTFHLGTITALKVYGVESDVALSLAIVLHLGTFAITVAPGILFLWSENLTLRSLGRLSEAPADPSPATPLSTERSDAPPP